MGFLYPNPRSRERANPTECVQGHYCSSLRLTTNGSARLCFAPVVAIKPPVDCFIYRSDRSRTILSEVPFLITIIIKIITMQNTSSREQPSTGRWQLSIHKMSIGFGHEEMLTTKWCPIAFNYWKQYIVAPEGVVTCNIRLLRVTRWRKPTDICIRKII